MGDNVVFYFLLFLFSPFFASFSRREDAAFCLVRQVNWHLPSERSPASFIDRNRTPPPRRPPLITLCCFLEGKVPRRFLTKNGLHSFYPKKNVKRIKGFDEGRYLPVISSFFFFPSLALPRLIRVCFLFFCGCTQSFHLFPW